MLNVFVIHRYNPCVCVRFLMDLKKIGPFRCNFQFFKFSFSQESSFYLSLFVLLIRIKVGLGLEVLNF